MKRTFYVLAALFIAGLACGESNPMDVPTPTQASSGREPALTPAVTDVDSARRLGIDVNETPAVDFGESFRLAKEVGVDMVSLSVYWDELETAPGVFEPDLNWLAIANDFYGREGVALSFVLSPIDTNVLHLPPDLQKRSFDDPELVERYLAAMDSALGELQDVELAAISIGNEVNAYLANHPQQWQAYGVLVERALNHLHARMPAVPVGVKATFDGLTGAQAEDLFRLNASSNVILATYYPLEDDFTIREPSSFGPDIERLLERYPRRPIYFLEVGCPSSSTLGSSEEKQAQFVRNVFNVWDHNHVRVPVVNFTWMHDISREALDSYSDYYGLHDRRFLAFLGTLGMRTHDGRDKLAFKALREEAAARGW